MARLLIVEDDVALGGFLRRAMEAEGYEVEVAGDGRAALGLLLEATPDLMILDLQMVGADGMEVLRFLRSAGAWFPVLVLTAHCELETRLECLDLGAEDCMFKPISIQELRARCRTMMRRTAQASTPVISAADLSLDRMERVAERGGRRIPLTNREYALLEQLVLEGGRCVARSTLARKVWGLRENETNVVDVYINYLRRKLDGPGAVSVIETVRGQGYRIAPFSPPTREAVPDTLQGRLG